jgi:hypothetical protein
VVKLKANYLRLANKIEKDGDLPVYLDFWHKVIEESESATEQIKLLSPGFPQNKDELSQQLAFYRSLSRYIAESLPVWSAYYSEIRASMGNIHDLLIDIDTQYKLGQHKNDP